MLFTFVGGRGHLEPLLPIARAAAAAGHDVAFAGQHAIVDAVEAEGFPAFSSGPTTVRTTKTALIAPDPEADDVAIRDRFAGTYARERLAALLPVMNEWRPDLVVCEEMDFGALIAAELLAVPSAVVVVIASSSFLRHELLTGSLNKIRADFGLAPDPDLSMLTGDLLLIPVPMSFREEQIRSPFTLHIRPAALDSAAQGSDGHSPRRPRPHVYVTLGTIFNLESGDLFSRLIAAVRELPVNVTVTVGPYIDPAELEPQPDNVRIASFIPNSSVLADCDLVVCHGGSGTVVGALAYGVPLVLIPMGADQLHNAARCETLGVGLTLDVMTATVDDIRQAVTTVLHQSAYRMRAAAMRDEILALPDSASAVRRLERLVNIGVTTLAPADWPILRDVRLHALSDSPDAFATTLEEAREWPPDRWMQIAPHRAVARVRGTVVGMIGWHAAEAVDATTEIVSVWVDPAHRGTGVADALFDHTLATCMTPAFELGVVVSNDQARRFYERRGFVRFGHEFVGRTGEPLVRMRFDRRQ